MNFYDTNHCRSGVHCGWCRNQEKGRAWRESNRVKYPHLQIADFACERGLPWGYEGQAESLPAVKGVGDHLHELVYARIGQSPCEECMGWIAKMNRWGPDGCEERADEIVDRLVSQVDKLGKLAALAVKYVPGAEAVARHEARAMLTEAIRLTREGRDATSH